MKPTLAEQKRAELEIITAMENSVEHMKNGKTDLRHYNESVFRFLFIEQLFQNDSIEIWDEWRRIDLLLRFKYSANGEEHSLFIPIEFKFYDHRIQRNFEKHSDSYKGGAGKKNFEEFVSSIQKLRNNESIQNDKVVSENVYARYVLLVAIDKQGINRMPFSTYYSKKTLPQKLASEDISYDVAYEKAENFKEACVIRTLLKV